MSIIDKANELSKMISQSEELDKYNKAEIVFLNDKELQNEYNEYKKMYTSYMVNKNNELETKIDMQYNKLLSNDNFNSYLKTKDDFEKLIATVHDIIDYHIEYKREKSCCKDKNNCGGCNKK